MKARMILPLIAAAGAIAAAAPATSAERCAGAPGEAATKLTVRVVGVRAAQGQVAVTVYPDDRRRFLAPGAKLMRVRATAQAPATSACFWLPPGAYAVAVYHDANGNKDFDRSIIGMPREGFAFSNDPSTRLGLPSFESVRFPLAATPTTIQMQMRYLD